VGQLFRFFFLKDDEDQYVVVEEVSKSIFKDNAQFKRKEVRILW